MTHRLLADVLVLLHLLFILFMLFGGLVALRWRWFPWWATLIYELLLYKVHTSSYLILTGTT